MAGNDVLLAVKMLALVVVRLLRGTNWIHFYFYTWLSAGRRNLVEEQQHHGSSITKWLSTLRCSAFRVLATVEGHYGHHAEGESVCKYSKVYMRSTHSAHERRYALKRRCNCPGN